MNTEKNLFFERLVHRKKHVLQYDNSRIENSNCPVIVESIVGSNTLLTDIPSEWIFLYFIPFSHILKDRIEERKSTKLISLFEMKI
jgi:hypothetical protein